MYYSSSDSGLPYPSEPATVSDPGVAILTDDNGAGTKLAEMTPHEKALPSESGSAPGTIERNAPTTTSSSERTLATGTDLPTENLPITNAPAGITTGRSGNSVITPASRQGLGPTVPRVMPVSTLSPGTTPGPVTSDELLSDDRMTSRTPDTAVEAVAASEQISPIDVALHPASPPLNMPAIPKGDLPIRLTLNTFVSPFNFNQVVTKYIPVYDLEVLADSRLTRGSSLGMLLEVNQGNSGIQFGAVYSKSNYIPTALKYYKQEEFPFIEPVKGYSRFRYETLELPFSYNQVVSTTEKWRWSARATMSISIIAKSSFDITDEPIIDAINRREERGQAVTQGNDQEGGRGAGAYDFRQLVDPPAGYFEGGDFFKNAHFYVGGGVMLERILNPRSSIYVSPSFGRVIYLNPDEAGIGPYQDRIHIGQLRFGTRFLLSGK